MGININKLNTFLSNAYKNVDINDLSNDLKEIIEDTSLPLVDIILVVTEFEDTIEDEDLKNNTLLVFDEIVDWLEDTEENTKRLYEFVVYDIDTYSYNVLLKLYNSDHLSDEQKDRLDPIAHNMGLEGMCC